MKQITIGQKKWRNRVNDSTVHEYPAGSTATVSDETAERAVKANALAGDPVDAPDVAPVKGKAADKTKPD